MQPRTFTTLYCLFAVPTYLLPILNHYRGFTHSAALLESPALLVHFLCLLVLIGLTWLRGLQTRQTWLITMPLLALAFDLLPGLNWIFLLPTFLHGAAIAIGGFKLVEPFDTAEG